jgi:hypothetical protein
MVLAMRQYSITKAWDPLILDKITVTQGSGGKSPEIR